MKKKVIHSLEELAIFAEELLQDFEAKSDALVVTLSGNLGAGKTAFTQALGKALGIEESIVSPTFILMRSYPTTHPVWKKLVHIDAYRFEEEKEAEVLRLQELFKERNTLICIEWPERIEHYLPQEVYALTFSIGEDESRIVLVEYGKI